MTPAIRVSNLSKVYRLGAQNAGADYQTLRESITHTLGFTWQRLQRLVGLSSRSTSRSLAPPDRFHALREISLDIQRGEVVGIIGRNGAGKSTLLKILSRITEPTEGRVELQGRVASLLEVGTGFHPELTGRENVYLNGAILGMSRREIARKFDEIVAFSEIEQFLETPVKRYSSGMYVRLAFGVAAHLQSEILIVDEVLAVGDMSFQKKCLGKMTEVSKSGRTILFVSHNIGAIKALCTSAILLHHGRNLFHGGVDEAVASYLRVTDLKATNGSIPDDTARIGTGDARVRFVRLTDGQGNPASELYLGQPFRVELSYEVFKRIPDAILEVSVATVDGVHVSFATTLDNGKPSLDLMPGCHRVEVEFNFVLIPRVYTLMIGIHHRTGRCIDLVERTHDFTVLNVAESTNDHYPWSRVRGYVRPEARWNHMGRP
jgi:lipopolysaccharide transport system ATP-binding protein